MFHEGTPTIAPTLTPTGAALAHAIARIKLSVAQAPARMLKHDIRVTFGEGPHDPQNRARYRLACEPLDGMTLAQAIAFTANGIRATKAARTMHLAMRLVSPPPRVSRVYLELHLLLRVMRWQRWSDRRWREWCDAIVSASSVVPRVAAE